MLAYRAFSFWLPTLPGAVAYFQLRSTVRRWEHDVQRTADLRRETDVPTEVDLYLVK